MNDDRSDLSQVATSTLTRLREAIGQGRVSLPITREALLDHGIRNQLDALEAALGGHSRLACLSVLDVILAERAANAHPAPELVWTGPERAYATARDSAVVLRELFEGAQHQVLLAGYDFRKGQSLLEPLWVAMRDRGVDVRFIVHFQQPEQALEDATGYGNEAVRALLESVWPFGDPRPRCYYDRRAVEPWPKFNMHAKCVVVDGKRALVTSANFTEAGHERNVECGVLLDDARFAAHMARQLWGLIEAGLVVEAGI